MADNGQRRVRVAEADLMMSWQSIPENKPEEQTSLQGNPI